MKKNDIIKTLKKLRTIFANSPAGVEALETLCALVPSLPEMAEETAQKETLLDWNSSFPLPSEMQGQRGEAYAIFADGACRGNPGPGAWAVMIQDVRERVILKSSGVDVPTTNNKMELEGVMRGLRGLVEKWVEEGVSDRESPVYVYSDSKYVVEGMSSWVAGWKSRGWKKADGKEPENLVLWRELDELKNHFNHIHFIWVKGHAGHPQNEMCDQMCNQALNEAGF